MCIRWEVVPLRRRFSDNRKLNGAQLTSDLSFTYYSERKVTLLFREVIMANDTKERIIDAALEMFSQNGYAGTNIRELSALLGLVKSGVYKHYGSKEAIWNALLDQMIAYYGEHFGSAEHLPPVPDSLDGLVDMTMRMVNFTVHDEKIIMTRKVLTLEQYRDARARELATKHFLTGLTEMFTHVFTGMMENGLLKRDDPKMLAFAYTTPVSALIHQCDREPEKAEEAIRQIEEFSRHFIRTYGKSENAKNDQGHAVHGRSVVPKDFLRDSLLVRLIESTERDKALQLAWRVFREFESPDYTPEGTEEFKKCLNDETYLAGIRYYGAIYKEELVGILGIREESCHICFFFVDGKYQRLGIGTKLFTRMRNDFPARTITLNSAPYGLPFYKALGFTATDSEKTVNGIRFTPMEYTGKRRIGGK